MNSPQIGSIVRWLSSVSGTFLFSHGYIDQSDVPLVTGAVLAGSALAWSLFRHSPLGQRMANLKIFGESP